MDSTYSRTLAFLWAGKPSMTRCTGLRLPLIICLSNSMNSSAVSAPLYVANQKPPRALTAEAAEIDWRWPGRSITGLCPLSAQVLPCTVSARNPDSSQK
ncbi:hypothetical protein N234_35040 [Ralstonia pickettii DTP0602]|nr:hypothetical protein N234_35040 [Ralstonia pickettii DTP0602]